MSRKLVIVSCFLALLATETTFFGRRCAAAFLRMQGEHALFRNDLERAFTRYRLAGRLGANEVRIETDLVELVLFGLDQVDAGMAVRQPLSEASSVSLAQRLIRDLLMRSPRNAYYWSLASDVQFHVAREQRREGTLDLTTLSEDPMANLLAEDRLGLAALATAASLEPNTYTYHDLLVEAFLELGIPDRAALYCRRAVAALPDEDEHKYLSRPDLPPQVLEAAVQGFEDALKTRSMTPRLEIECDVGGLLMDHGQDQRALRHLRAAVALAPRAFSPRYLLAQARYHLADYAGAIADLEQASRAQPDNPWPYYLTGLSYRQMGQLSEAIAALRQARETAPSEIRFFQALGETLERAGQVPEAERQYRAIATLAPKDAESWLGLIEFYQRHGDVQRAYEACAQLADVRPGDPALLERCAGTGGGER